jgi:hypothetical protein
MTCLLHINILIYIFFLLLYEIYGFSLSKSLALYPVSFHDTYQVSI